MANKKRADWEVLATRSWVLLQYVPFYSGDFTRKTTQARTADRPLYLFFHRSHVRSSEYLRDLVCSSDSKVVIPQTAGIVVSFWRNSGIYTVKTLLKIVPMSNWFKKSDWCSLNVENQKVRPIRFHVLLPLYWSCAF